MALPCSLLVIIIKLTLLSYGASSLIVSSALNDAMLYNFSSIYTEENPLRVLVPRKLGFEEFVSGSNASSVDGFCIQVFKQALQRLPHPPYFQFQMLPGENETTSYDVMIHKLVNGRADAIAADLTITSERMDKVDFTVPYLASSLVMVTTYSYGSAGTLWDFMKPFSWKLWMVLLSSFVATGGALYLLENKNPDFSVTSYYSSTSMQQQGPPIYDAGSRIHRVLNAFWFTCLCIFAAQRESVRTHSGRIITVTWLCTMLIFNNSYTASLASLLSAQKSYPIIDSFKALKESNASVGYQSGSFLENMLLKLGISADRLKAYNSWEDYSDAMRQGDAKGGVAAVLDEQPYTQILLRSTCGFMAVDDQVSYFGGFGFAFRKDSSQLVDAISGGILSLAEDCVLQKLKNGWIGTQSSNPYCASSNEAYHMRLRSFGGLFAIIFVIYLLCLLWRFCSKFVVMNQR